jgi:hypothetical protein
MTDDITPSVKQIQWRKCLTSKLSTIFRGRSVFRARLSGFLRPATQACGKNIAKGTIIRGFLSNSRSDFMTSTLNLHLFSAIANCG